MITKNADIVEDEVSLNSLMAKAKYFLKDCSSLAIVKETYTTPQTLSETDIQIEPKPVHILAGILILKIIHKSDYSRTFMSVIMTDGEAQRKCINFYSALHRGAKISQIMHCESHMNYFYVCIKPEFRHRGKIY